MKKTILLFSSLYLFLSSISYAQCSFDGNYADIFTIEIGYGKDSSKFLITRVDSVEEDRCYAKAVNTMPDFFSYLKTNFGDRSLYAEIDLDQDSAALEAAFANALNKDKELTQLLDQFTDQAYGKKKKDSVLLAELVDVAVKYFNILDVDEKGRLRGKVCAGINQVEQTLPERNPFLEAFAFATIMYDVKNLEPNLMDEFEKEMKVLLDLNLGNDDQERVLRAQGAMFMLMKQNARLNSMLASIYVQNMSWLPFALKGN